MKKYFLNALLVSSLFLGLSSCDKTEGPILSDNSDKISFLSSTTSLAMSGGSISVPVGRTNTAADNSFTLTLTAAGAGYTNVFALDGPVKFAAGEGKSYANVKYGDISKIDPSALSVTGIANNDVRVGLAFPISLNIGDNDISYGNKKKIDVNASSILEFEELGTGQLNSIEGWAGASGTVKIQKAKTANVYKIISPFGANSIAFMVKSDGKSIVFPNQIIDNHPTYGPVTMGNVVATISGKVVTINVGAYTVSAGSFGGGVEIITLP